MFSTVFYSLVKYTLVFTLNYFIYLFAYLLSIIKQCDTNGLSLSILACSTRNNIGSILCLSLRISYFQVYQGLNIYYDQFCRSRADDYHDSFDALLKLTCLQNIFVCIELRRQKVTINEQLTYAAITFMFERHEKGE